MSAEKTKFWYLSNIDLLKGMSFKEMKWAEEKTTMKHYKNGDPIHSLDDSLEQIYFILKNCLKRGILQ